MYRKTPVLESLFNKLAGLGYQKSGTQDPKVGP